MDDDREVKDHPDLLATLASATPSVAATSDSGPPSRLGEVDASRVESSHAHDFNRLLSRTQVNLSRLESLESTLVYREMDPREFELLVHLSHSGEDADGAGDIVESDREEESHDEGGFTRHRDNHERRGISRHACRRVSQLPGYPGKALLEFSGPIVAVNDAPDQSGVVAFGLEVHYFWISICWDHMIVGEPHVQPGKMSRAYEIPAKFCKEPHEAPHLLSIHVAFVRQAQELGLFDSEATIQPDGTPIAIHRYFNPGTRFQMINETTLELYSFCLVVDQPEMPAASDPHYEVWCAAQEAESQNGEGG
ncbi:hypothetical protein B0H14DRAFT_2629886 [Mycena olivaceomarginata]|nr:hypothetical protein B0H14DRAFT_2629886 [Mycena olivaceomarginata]